MVEFGFVRVSDRGINKEIKKQKRFFYYVVKKKK